MNFIKYCFHFSHFVFIIKIMEQISCFWVLIAKISSAKYDFSENLKYPWEKERILVKKTRLLFLYKIYIIFTKDFFKAQPIRGLTLTKLSIVCFVFFFFVHLVGFILPFINQMSLMLGEILGDLDGLTFYLALLGFETQRKGIFNFLSGLLVHFLPALPKIARQRVVRFPSTSFDWTEAESKQQRNSQRDLALSVCAVFANFLCQQLVFSSFDCFVRVACLYT